MAIRSYRPSDWPRVCDIWNRAKRDEFRGAVDLSALIPLERDPEMQEHFHRSAMFVLERRGRVVGFAGHEDRVITWLFVDPDDYRRGIGSRLLLHLLGRIDGDTSLMVLSSNRAAIELYERFGFAAVKSFQTSHHGHPVRALRMERNAPRGAGRR